MSNEGILTEGVFAVVNIWAWELFLKEGEAIFIVKGQQSSDELQKWIVYSFLQKKLLLYSYTYWTSVLLDWCHLESLHPLHPLSLKEIQQLISAVSRPLVTFSG